MGLADLADQIRPGFLMGTHSKHTQFSGKPSTVLLNNYNMISVGIYQRASQKDGVDDWEFWSIDQGINYAEENNLKVYAHPMFGSDGYLPDWLATNTFSDVELLEIIEDRIETLLTRYHGKIDILDVYNEGLGRESHGWRSGQNKFLQLGYNSNEIGEWPVFLEKMLIWCRQYGGDDLKLIYNDNHNTLDWMTQSEDCIQLFKALKHEGIPIDGIGLQCHTHIDRDGKHYLSGRWGGNSIEFDEISFAEGLRKMGEAGIETYISEADVHLYGTIDETTLARQAEAYRQLLRACINEPTCKSFKTWGYSDASCWKPAKDLEGDNYEPEPLPFDFDYNPKPAYYAMHALLADTLEHTDFDILVNYKFDDAAGTKLTDLANYGDDQTGWNGDQPLIEADGGGNLQVGAVTNTSITTFALESPLTRGYAELEYRIDGYDLSGLADKTSVGVEFWPAGAGWELATKMRLEVKDSTPNGIRLVSPRPTAFDPVVSYPAVDLDAMASTTGITYKIELDLDAGTFEVKYKLDSDAEFSAFGATGVCTNLAQIRLVVAHKSDWTVDHFVDIDYIKLVRRKEPEPAYAGDVWQFNDVEGNRLPELVKASGDATFNYYWETIESDGLGALKFYQEPGLANGRGAEATGMPDISTGKIELRYKMLEADLSGGDASGAMVSFSLKDSTANKNLFAIRLFEQSGHLQLQSRVTGDVNSENVVHYDFGTNVVDRSMDIRILADMDSDTFDVFYTLEDGMEVNATNNMPMGTAGLTYNDLRLYTTVNTNDFGPSDYITFDYLGVIPVEENLTYAGWLAQYPSLGSLTNVTDNPDGDALNNLGEYAFGGHPDDSADVGHLPTFQWVENEGGFDYVYARRTDAAARGLNYYIETNRDLTDAFGWTNAGYNVVGTNAAFADGFETVSNRISAAVDTNQFIRITVERF
ncbi:endo-1,4-beta-xylanase [Pontiella sp. NLcol2]|uniref:endo-1,4-beta-xylanase n=2 Tax=Pontiella agarivorans TaxID=3038953 RepID=A0ABU5MXY3_9BACT|nr:endo-1,4-beta-xylanase [Pontiella agarivorans]